MSAGSEKEGPESVLTRGRRQIQPGSESKENLYSPSAPQLYSPQVAPYPKIWVEPQAEDESIFLLLLVPALCSSFSWPH